MDDHDRLESFVLHALCQRGPLKAAELTQEFGDDAEDAADELWRKGLVHRIDGGFLIPSAPGRHADRIDASWM